MLRTKDTKLILVNCTGKICIGYQTFMNSNKTSQSLLSNKIIVLLNKCKKII